MSYILDALKRSEQERQAGEPEPPDQAAVLRAEAPAQRGSRWPWLAGELGLNVLVLGVVLWPHPQNTPIEPEPPQVMEKQAHLAEIAGAALQPKLQPPRTTPSTSTPPEAASLASAPAPKLALEPPPTPAPPSTPVRLHEVPRPLRERLPEYGVAVHVYTQAAAERFVVVDGKRYREGDRLGGGVLLDSITPRGMVLEFEGWRFEYPVN